MGYGAFGYNYLMSGHEDRSPLIMKVSLRQARARIQEERSSLGQLEALASHLGWEEVASELAAAGEDVARAAARLDEAVEAAVRLQAETSHAHSHSHAHIHVHSHMHEHPHDHEHGGEVAGPHEHEHTHAHEHPHVHPHDHEH